MSAVVFEEALHMITGVYNDKRSQTEISHTLYHRANVLVLICDI